MNADGTKGATPGRFVLMLLTGLSALMLVVALSLWLSGFHVRAEPAVQTAGENPLSTTALTDTGNLNTSATTKTVSSEDAVVGDTLTYTIRVANMDSENPYDVIGARLTDTLPAGLSLISGSLTSSPQTDDLGEDNGVITWTDTVAYSSVHEIQFRAQISEGVTSETWLTNTIEISSPSQLFTRSVGTYVADRHLTYMPVILRAWPPTPVLNPIPAPDASRSYEVSWQGVEQAIDHYTLQQGKNQEFISAENSWAITETSKQIQNAYCAYYYRVRADNAVRWGEGPWSNIERAQASPPGPPVLNDIEDPDEDNTYTVSWSPVSVSQPSVAVDTYVLQESTDPSFGSITRQWSTSSTSKVVGNEQYDTYYYRVRADDADCWGEGPWSDAKSILTVFMYFDDFSDMNSGWPSLVDDERWAFYEVDPNPPDPDDGSDYPDDGDGYFIARRSGGEPFARFGPGVAVPSNYYEIEVDTRWWDARWYATYQILFGANESLSRYYAVRVMIDDIEQICKFSVVRHTSSGTEVLNGGWRDVSEIHCEERRDDSDAPWNHWRIRREGDWITVYVNGKYLGQWDDSSYGANRYFGVRSTLYEGFTPSKPEYDNWSVRLLD